MGFLSREFLCEEKFIRVFASEKRPAHLTNLAGVAGEFSFFESNPDLADETDQRDCSGDTRGQGVLRSNIPEQIRNRFSETAFDSRLERVLNKIVAALGWQLGQVHQIPIFFRAIHRHIAELGAKRFGVGRFEN